MLYPTVTVQYVTKVPTGTVPSRRPQVTRVSRIKVAYKSAIYVPAVLQVICIITCEGVS
jgi:hypothetical protein